MRIVQRFKAWRLKRKRERLLREAWKCQRTALFFALNDEPELADDFYRQGRELKKAAEKLK